MSWLAEAHRDWHTVNGWVGVTCPLDCYLGEEEPYEESGVTVTCGHCKSQHWGQDRNEALDVARKCAKDYWTARSIAKGK